MLENWWCVSIEKKNKRERKARPRPQHLSKQEEEEKIEKRECFLLWAGPDAREV
jgi:hypothetical protein